MSLAAIQNISPNWHAIFSRLGLNVVAVRLDIRRSSPVHSHPRLEEALGLELQELGLGYYDSSFYPGCLGLGDTGSAWHWFHSNALGAAMQRLKSQLAARGLLDYCNILHAEEHNELRVWWSPDASIIGKAIIQ